MKTHREAAKGDTQVPNSLGLARIQAGHLPSRAVADKLQRSLFLPSVRLSWQVS